MTLSMFARYVEFSIIYTGDWTYMLYFYHYRFEPYFSNFTSQYAMFGWYLPCSAKKWGKALESDLVVSVCPRLESFHLAMGENYLCVHILKVWLLYGFSPQARFSEIKSKQTKPEWIAYNSFTARKKKNMQKGGGLTVWLTEKSRPGSC